MDGDEHDRRRVNIALDDDGLVNAVGELAADGVDLFRRVDGGGVSVGREIQLQRNAGLAVGSRGVHVLDVRDGRQGVFNRFYDLLLYGIGVGTGIADGYGDVRRVEGRQELYANAVEAEEA